MNQFLGKTCPYCKTAFTEEDDVVVCSVCEMPHHKDCWVENQGCTTFGCLGTIQSPDGGPQPPSESADAAGGAQLYCPKCGALHRSGDRFCGNCGNPLAPPAVPSAPPAPPYPPYRSAPSAPYSPYGAPPAAPPYTPPASQYPPRENRYESDFEEDMFIEQEAGFYRSKFNEMRSLHKNTSWNWAAFLFAPYWCFYRKLYGWGAGLLCAIFVLSFLGLFGTLALLAGRIAFGFLANNLYMSRIERLAATARGIQEPYKSQFIQKNSGTSVLAAVLVPVGFFILTIIIALI